MASLVESKGTGTQVCWGREMMPSLFATLSLNDLGDTSLREMEAKERLESPITWWLWLKLGTD